MNTKKYVIVFDLDETIGYFSDIYIFWNLLNNYINHYNIDYKYLYNLFDLFPEIFRTDIFKLFKILKIKKENNLCDNVMLFTNNNGPTYWVTLIKNYIHEKINYKLFDQIIRAFKVNGNIIEPDRTTNNKKYSDLLNCTKLPKNTEICFIDDSYFKEMIHDNVLYIQLRPYYYYIDFKLITNTFYNNNINLFKTSYNHFEDYILSNINNINNRKIINRNKYIVKYNEEVLITNKLITEINNFFIYKGTKHKKTKKNKKYKIKTIKL